MNTSTSPVVITDIAQGTYTYSGANTITVYSMPGPYSHTTNTTKVRGLKLLQLLRCLVEQASQIHYSTAIALSSPVTIPAGATYGFYVGGVGTVSYATASNAGPVGSSVASDAFSPISSVTEDHQVLARSVQDHL